MTAPAPQPATRCRALVAGIGLPGLRDLDAGRQFVRYAQQFDWPEGVVVEDLSCAAHLVLHRLLELDPAHVVFVAAVARGDRPPGCVRRYEISQAAPEPAKVHAGLSGSVGGVVDLDHTLSVVRHWGGLPPGTAVIEVEPSDRGIGPGFSEELAGALDLILELVREEVGAGGGSPAPPPATGAARPPAPVRTLVPTLEETARRARDHRDVSAAVGLLRHSLPLAAPVAVPGLAVASRFRPFGRGAESRGSWYDLIPLGGRRLGVAIGEVAEQGLQAAVVVAHLRATVRAHATLAGPSPIAVVEAVDASAAETGLGRNASLLYATVDAGSGHVRLANAGHCPPIVRHGGRAVERLLAGRAGPLGAERRGRGVPEVLLTLGPGSVLLLHTAGLAAAPRTGRDDGDTRLVDAVRDGPADLEYLCDRVLAACLTGARRQGDAALLALSPTGRVS